MFVLLKIQISQALKVKNQNLYWVVKLIKIKNQLGAQTEEEFNKVIMKILEYPYTMENLKKDLKDMSAIVNNAYRG